MYETLRSRIVDLLARARPLRPQTERQLASHLVEHATSPADFLRCASDLLEDYELEILFGPQFTPTLDERAELADLLFHWRPDPQQLARLVCELANGQHETRVLLPDGLEARLPLHEVMIERFVRLLRLDRGPAPEVAASMRDELSADLWKLAVALLCEQGMSPAHQRCFADFVHQLNLHGRNITRPLLESVATFIASQTSLEQKELLRSGQALLRATAGTAAYAASGHQYWSADVAQHHHYRGQGGIDPERVRRQQQELENVTILVEELRTMTEGVS